MIEIIDQDLQRLFMTIRGSFGAENFTGNIDFPLSNGSITFTSEIKLLK
jgi:hypothetical protein